MPENMMLIHIEAKKPDIRKKFQQVIRSMEGMQLQGPGDTRRADLLIFELGTDAEKEFELIQSLLNSNTVGDVFLTSENTDPAILLQAIRTGAKEFFSQPLQDEEVKSALEKLRDRTGQSQQNEPTKIGRIINVIGSKGGVGTTTVAVNLAVALAKGKSSPTVAIVDLNTLYGEVPLFLAFKPVYDWGTIIKNIARLDATFLMNILSKHDCGVYILPSPAHLNGNRGSAPEIMERLLLFMQTMFDYVVVDGGQAVDDTVLKVIEISSDVLLVSVLSLPCLSNTNKLFNSFTDLGFLPRERIRIVINRHLKNSDISIKDAEDGVNEKIFWTIPNDYRTTMAAINYGKTLSQIAPKAPVTKNLEGLAEALAASEQKQEKKRWKFLSR